MKEAALIVSSKKPAKLFYVKIAVLEADWHIV